MLQNFCLKLHFKVIYNSTSGFDFIVWGLCLFPFFNLSGLKFWTFLCICATTIISVHPYILKFIFKYPQGFSKCLQNSAKYLGRGWGKHFSSVSLVPISLFLGWGHIQCLHLPWLHLFWALSSLPRTCIQLPSEWTMFGEPISALLLSSYVKKLLFNFWLDLY